MLIPYSVKGSTQSSTKATCNVLHLPSYENYYVSVGRVVHCSAALLIDTDKFLQLQVLKYYMVCKRLITLNHLLQITKQYNCFSFHSHIKCRSEIMDKVNILLGEVLFIPEK